MGSRFQSQIRFRDRLGKPLGSKKDRCLRTQPGLCLCSTRFCQRQPFESHLEISPVETFEIGSFEEEACVSFGGNPIPLLKGKIQQLSRAIRLPSIDGVIVCV